MNYHLAQGGKDAGTFPLEELRQKRQAGELSGTELVWRDGMPAWEALDAVLHSQGMAVAGAPPPVPAHARRGLAAGVIAAIVAGVLVFGGMIVYIAVKAIERVQMVQRSVSRAAQGRAEGEEAAAPVTFSTNTQTEADTKLRARAFRVRQYVQGYEKNARHDQPCDTEGRLLIKSWIASVYGGTDETNLPPAQTLADKLTAQPGCDEPMIWLVAGITSIEVHEKTRRLEKAVSGFQQSKHKGYPKFYATVTLVTDLGTDSARAPALDASALGYLKEAFADGSFVPGDEPELGEILVNGWAEQFVARHGQEVCEIIREAKGYPWLALVVEGDFERNEAWRMRGSGWGNQVTAAGWKGFEDHLNKARKALTAAAKAHPERPLAAQRMISVAMGSSDAEEMRSWFEKAIAAQIDYPGAWSSMRYGLRPRWHGSHEAMLQLGRRAVETGRFDTDVPRKYFDFISDVESELDLAPGEHIYGRPDVWPALQRMYEGYIAQSAETNRDLWRSTFVAVAFLGGRLGVARPQLEALDWKPHRGNLTGWGRDLSLLPLQVAALTGKAAGEAQSAEDAFARQDYSQAIAGYTALSNNSHADERTRELCALRLAALAQEQRLAKGEWIDLLPSADNDPNWLFTSGKAHRLDDGSLEIEAGPVGHSLYSRVRVGTQFEVKGEFEVVRTSNGDFQAGLVMGLPDAANANWYSFRLKRNPVEGQLVSFATRWTAQEVTKKIALNDRTNSFQFRLRDGKADAWVNGTQLLQNAAPAKKMRLFIGSMLGLGAYNDMNQTVIRYTNVKVRRVD